jgi:hypothetical protein
MTRRYTREAQEQTAREAELDGLVRALDAECRNIEATHRWIENPVPVANLNPYFFAVPPPTREVPQTAWRNPYERGPPPLTELPYRPPPPRQGARRRGFR